MTRKDLINKVSQEFHLKKKEAEAIVKFIFQEITEAFLRGEKVSIQGFGTFTIKRTLPRKVRLPNGEWIEIPSREKITFHISPTILSSNKPK
jgi:nucleoid DNA-binding protein